MHLVYQVARLVTDCLALPHRLGTSHFHKAVQNELWVLSSSFSQSSWCFRSQMSWALILKHALSEPLFLKILCGIQSWQVKYHLTSRCLVARQERLVRCKWRASKQWYHLVISLCCASFKYVFLNATKLSYSSANNNSLNSLKRWTCYSSWQSSPHSIKKLSLAQRQDVNARLCLSDMLQLIMLLWRTRSAHSCGLLRVSCGTSTWLTSQSGWLYCYSYRVVSLN